MFLHGGKVVLASGTSQAEDLYPPRGGGHSISSRPGSVGLGFKYVPILVYRCCRN